MKLTAGGEVRARILAIDFVCFFPGAFFSFFLFLSFIFLPTSGIFSRSNAHIQTGRDAERLRGDVPAGEQFASLDLWITDECLI